MTNQLKSGDRVTWKSHGGTAEGKVLKKLTSPTQIKGHKVAARRIIPNIWSRRKRGGRRRTKRRR